MSTEVQMPQMGESIAEGTLVRWLKSIGDAITRDEPLFEITTDKVDTEVPAPTSGYLKAILVEEGETVPVDTVVCVIASEASDAAGGTDRLVSSTVDAQAGGDSVIAPPQQEDVVPRPAASRKGRVRTKSSPIVRKIAAEHGIELDDINGTGIDGRVTKDDITQFLEQRSAQTAMPPTMAADRIETMSVMRQQIAEHMVLSRRTAAHVTTLFEVDMTNVRARRDELDSKFSEEGTKLTYLPFILQATAKTLGSFPILNASVEKRRIRYHGNINIGVAVALEHGLIVPVIKKANSLSLVQLSRVIQDLALRARNKKLKPEEVQGGTFTITNPGVFGALVGTPIINQPQVGILCVGKIQKRPVVLPDTDAIAIRVMVYLSLSYDHRLIDGAVADQFLAEIKTRLETDPFQDFR